MVTTVIAMPVGSSRAEVVIAVVADADTLFGATTRGLLIHLDDEGLFHLHWSPLNDFEKLRPSPLLPVVTVAHHAGTEAPLPGAILSGAPGVVGTKVVQRVTAGLNGADYLPRCQLDTAAGARLVLAGVLPVRTA